MNKIRLAISFIRGKKETLNKIVPWFLMTYFIFICFPYIFARSPQLNAVFTNSIVAYIIRFGFIALYVFFGLILMVANRFKPKYAWIIMFSILSLLSLISNFTSPDNIVSYSVYFTSKVSITTQTIGTLSKLIDSFRFIASLLFLYFLITVYPYCFKNRNQFSYVVLPAIIIGLIGVFYTLIFENKLLNDAIQGRGSPEGIISIFHSKNAYGIFLFNGAVASTFIFFSDTRKWTKFIILALPLFFIIAFLINCKLAAVCILILFLSCYVFAIFRYMKTRRVISFVLLGFALLTSILIILIFSVPSLHKSGIFGAIYNKIIDEFQHFDLSSFIGRTYEWTMVPIMANGIFTFIGFSRAIGYSVVSGFTSINGGQGVSDLHNAYVDFYAYHGIVGCLILAFIYGFVIYKVFKLFRVNKYISILLFIVLFVSILFGMAETYTLFISMSANTFVLNVIIIGVVLFESKFKSEEKWL